MFLQTYSQSNRLRMLTVSRHPMAMSTLICFGLMLLSRLYFLDAQTTNIPQKSEYMHTLNAFEKIITNLQRASMMGEILEGDCAKRLDDSNQKLSLIANHLRLTSLLESMEVLSSTQQTLLECGNNISFRNVCNSQLAQLSLPM